MTRPNTLKLRGNKWPLKRFATCAMSNAKNSDTCWRLHGGDYPLTQNTKPLNGRDSSGWRRVLMCNIVRLMEVCLVVSVIQQQSVSLVILEVLRVCGNRLYAIMCCSLVLKLRTDYLPTLPCFIASHIHSTENVY